MGPGILSPAPICWQFTVEGQVGARTIDGLHLKSPSRLPWTVWGASLALALYSVTVLVAAMVQSNDMGWDQVNLDQLDGFPGPVLCVSRGRLGRIETGPVGVVGWPPAARMVLDDGRCRSRGLPPSSTEFTSSSCTDSRVVAASWFPSSCICSAPGAYDEARVCKARRVTGLADLPTIPFWANELARFGEALERNDLLEDADREAWARRSVPRIQARVAEHPEDVIGLERSLQEVRPGMELASFFQYLTWMPESLFTPILARGLREPAEGVFVRASVACFGHRRVIEWLLGVFEAGSDTEKVSACDCLYWAQPGLRYVGKANFDLRVPTEESRAAFELLYDLRVRKAEQLLREFLRNPDRDVRAAILRGEKLDVDTYPESLQPLAREALACARNLGMVA